MRAIILAALLVSGCASFTEITINCIPHDDSEGWVYLDPKNNDLEQFSYLLVEEEQQQKPKWMNFWYQRDNELLACSVPNEYKWSHNLPKYKNCVFSDVYRYKKGRNDKYFIQPSKGYTAVCT